MTTKQCSILAKVAACALLVTLTVQAKAQTEFSPISKSQARWIVVGVAAGGAALGIGIYYAVHHGHTLNGCAVSGPGGLELQNGGDQQTYALIGEVAGVKPGNRVRVSDKKEKKNSGIPQQFLVEKLSRDYGSCKVQTATR
jgi:hypothetical protein